MKVSEVISRLKVGDTVWVKGKVSDTDKSDQPLYVCIGGTGYKWLGNSAEISLTEPQAEKVEVPEFVAKWYESHRGDLEYDLFATTVAINNLTSKEDEAFEKWFDCRNTKPYETIIKMKLFGYTVKPKRWVVRLDNGRYVNDFQEAKFCVGIGITLEMDCLPPFKFTDKSKAEAVATLVEGSVEEV